MTIQVQGPDGAMVEFPDGTPPETMQSALAAHYGAPTADPNATAVAPVDVSAPSMANAPMSTAGADPAAPPPSQHPIADAVGNAAETGYAGVRAFGHSLLGVGDLAATAGHMGNEALNGQPVDYATARAAAEAERKDLEARHPIASLVGGIGGAVDTGVLGGAALKAVGVGMPAALALRQAQPVANVGRMAAQGAIAGATQGGAQGAAVGAQQNGAAGAVQGGAAGAATGGVAGGVGGAVIGPVAGAVARVTQPLADKVARALAKTLAESPADVQAAWTQFQQATGRIPSMAEIASLKARGEIKAAAQDSTAIGTALNQRAEQAAADRAQAMQTQFDSGVPGRPTISSGDVANNRDVMGDQEFGAVRQQQFPLQAEDRDYLQGTVLPATNLSRTARQTIAQELEAGHLSGNSAMLIRKSLGTQARSRPGEGFKELQQDVDGIISDPSQGQAGQTYSAAVDNYARRSSNAEGVELGEKAVGASDTPNYLAQVDAAQRNPATAAAVPAGVRTALYTKAQTPAGATSLATKLATDDGLYQRITGTLGQPTADAFRRLGQAESGAATNMSAVAPTTPAAESQQEADDISRALHTVAAASPHGSPFWKTFHLGKLLSGTRMSPAVQDRVADYLSDPNMVRQGINLLRKAGVDNARLRQISLQGAQAAGILGGAAGAATTEDQQ